MAYLALIVEDVIINKWQVSEKGLLIGRAKGCDVQIDDQSVSSKHARLVVEVDAFFKEDKHYYIEDLKSTNGTECNEKKIERKKLVDGDIIKIGFNQFQFVSNNNIDLDETAIIIK